MVSLRGGFVEYPLDHQDYQVYLVHLFLVHSDRFLENEGDVSEVDGGEVATIPGGLFHLLLQVVLPGEYQGVLTMQDEFQVLPQDVKQYFEHPFCEYQLHDRLTHVTLQYNNQHLEDVVSQELLVGVLVLLELDQLEYPEVDAIVVLYLLYVVSGYQNRRL